MQNQNNEMPLLLIRITKIQNTHTPGVGEEVGQQELPFGAVGDAKRGSHFERQFDDFLYDLSYS